MLTFDDIRWVEWTKRETDQGKYVATIIFKQLQILLNGKWQNVRTEKVDGPPEKGQNAL